MTRLTSTLTLLAVAAGFVLSSSAAFAQNGSSAPHRVGLIDMAHIFKHYKRFVDQRADLKTEIKNSDSKAKAMVAEMKKLKTQHEDPTLKKGSPQKKALLQALITKSAEYQSFRQDEQQRFLDKEAKIYKSVYMEVSKAVKIYANYYKYTLVLRWSRKDVGAATDPKAILGGLNRLVIFSRPGDDITQSILDHLNKSYKPRRTAARP